MRSRRSLTIAASGSSQTMYQGINQSSDSSSARVAQAADSSQSARPFQAR